MKKINRLYFVLSVTLTVAFLFSGCSDSPEAVAKKKIKQSIDVNSMGMLKDVNIQSMEKVNDSTFKCAYTFKNPLLNKEMRITKNYYFTQKLDSIKGDEDLSTEIKSEGEWVKFGF